METDLTIRPQTPEPALEPATKPHSEDTHAKGEKTTSEKDMENDSTETDTPVGGKVESASGKDVDKVYITGIQLIIVMGSLALSCFLMLLDTSIINTAIPSITAEFQSLPDIGWYTAAYQLARHVLACASLQPLTGKLYTYFKAKWTYLIFFLIFELGSLVCGLAKSSPMLIGGRAIAGLGGSGLINGGMTIIAGAVPLEKRPLYTGLLIGIGQLGIICGPLIGGALTQYATWRWCFFINLPVGGVLAFLLIFCKTPDLTVKPPFSLSLVRETIPELDLVGFALFAPAAVMFLLALQWGGNNYPWNSSVVVGLFVGAGATAILFVLWERHMGERAMLPGSVIKQRIVWSSAVNGMSLMAIVFTAAQYMPVYFQGVRGEGPAMSGVDLLPSILGQLFMVVMSGILIQRVGYYLPFAVISGAISAIGNGLVSTCTPWTETARWAGYQILLGGGRGIGMQLGLVAIQNVLSPHQIPVGVAFLIFCQNFSGAIFVVVGTVIFTQSLVSELAVHAPSVSPEAALAAGASASAVRSLVPAGSSELDGVLVSFANAVSKVFYLLVACSLVGLVSAFGMGWVNVRKKKAQVQGDA
ncbi:putative Major facilitator superfamily domain-containing protein [Seiridium cardinale]|uniref:Major facilitator superfamily domain-containing protein n=1 Tax=Seiridium cardinale TaxID=138064 RepID=A0ABR2X5G2_9PEZI